VDFFSIGTNDLTQYIMAADRDNPDVAHLFDYFQPAVLRSIEATITAAKQAGISISMCGEMAGDTLALPLLVGIGLRDVSMTPARIPEFKLDVKNYSYDDCFRLFEELMHMETAAEITKTCTEFTEKHRRF
jgi:phosphoenolpyruvate-protein kinase (PTS system EI component)